MMDFEKQLQENVAKITDMLEQYIPKQEVFPPVIFEAMRYSLFAGGKRLRPMLVLEACKAVGGNCKQAQPFACALEMIHTYSLIHDDLPAMDNDDLRRGKPTNHKKFGEAMAILAGDGLLHQAMQIMANACYQNPCKQTTGAMLAVAKGAGLQGMLTGQVVDVYFEGTPLDAKKLEFIHLHKTAAMIKGALQAGASVGGASDDMVEQFGVAGEKMGVAFQILDDILDVTQTTQILGKPAHSDEKNKKNTFVTMYGIEKSKQIAEEFTEEALSIWESMGQNAAFLKTLTQYLLQRTY